MVRIILVLQLSLSPLANAGTADQYIAGTHKQARAEIDGHFNELLLSSVFSALQMEISNRGKDLADRLENLERSVARRHRLLDSQSRLQPAESAKESAKEIEQLSADFADTLVKLKTDHMFVRDLENDSVRAPVLIRRSAEKFLSNLSEICKSGIDTKTQIDLFPIARPLTPHFEFHVEHTVSGDTTDPSANRSHFTVGARQEEIALWTSMVPVGMIVIASVMKGELLLTASAMMAKGVFVQALAGATLGVGAIAALVIVLKLLEAQNKSERQVKNQRRMFEERATVEDARAYSKELCRETYGHVSDLSTELDRLTAGDAAMEALVESKRQENEAFVNSILPAFEALKLKREELLKAHEPETAENLKTEVEAVIKVGQTMTPAKFAHLIRFQFLNTFKQAQVGTKAVRDRLRALSDTARLRELDSRNRELRHLARLHNERALSAETRSAWSEAVTYDRELGTLSVELDRLVLRYATDLSNPDVNLAESAHEVNAWKTRFDAWKAKAGRSPSTGNAMGAETQLLERRARAL